MRRLLVALCLLAPSVASARGGPLVVVPGKAYAGLIASTGMRGRFYAGLDDNGFSPTAALTTSWPVSGVVAPTVYWSGADPTGALGISSHTFTLTGATESVNTPFCPDGGWNDVTNGCMTAQRHDGTNDDYTSVTDDIASPTSVDFSACGAWKYDIAGSSAWLFGSRESNFTGEGWGCYNGNSNGAICQVENHAATQTSANGSNKDSRGNWLVICFTVDFDGNSTTYVNGVAGTAVASPGGVVAPVGEPFMVGGAENGTSRGKGDFAWFAYWPTTLLSSTDVAAIHNQFSGILDTRGATVAQSNTGPQCCQLAGSLECFGDDMPMLGCEEPTSGGPDGGLLVSPSLTNSVVRSDALGTSWTAVDGGGAAVVSTASTSAYRDGRITTNGSRLTDDQAGTIEYVQDVGSTVTSLAAADKVQICAYSRDASGTVLDLQVVESGVCGGSTTNYAAKTITTTWTRYCWGHALADTTCTTLQIRLSPADFADAANTGTADVMAVGVYHSNGAAGGQAWIPAHFCPTTTAAVTCGSQIIAWTPAAGSIFNGAGALVGNVRMGMRFAPVVADNLVLGTVFAASKLAGGNYSAVRIGTTELLHAATYDGGLSTNATEVAAGCAVPGTMCVVKAGYNYDTDQYSLTVGAAVYTGAAADVSPTGMDHVRAGATSPAATTVTGGFFIDHAEIKR